MTILEHLTSTFESIQAKHYFKKWARPPLLWVWLYPPAYTHALTQPAYLQPSSLCATSLPATILPTRNRSPRPTMGDSGQGGAVCYALTMATGPAQLRQSIYDVHACYTFFTLVSQRFDLQARKTKMFESKLSSIFCAAQK